MLAGQLEIRLFSELTEIAQNMRDAERLTEGSMNKIGAAIGAGMAAGWEKAKTAWQAFKEWSEQQIVIWGVALAIGVSAAVLGAVYAAFKAISFAVGLLTGESYKSENIDALAAMNREVKTLQENLPLTAAGASALNEALKVQGTSAAAYAETLNAVSTALRTNREELDRLGVVYKDRSGNLLSTTEILANAKGVLESYTEGWDRNQAAIAIGMGSEKQIQSALSVSAERIQTAKDRLIDYGLVIGTDTQAQVARYEDAMRAFNRELDLTSQGFKRAIADNIMPVLTDLAEFFRDGFPTAVMAFRYSMATVVSLFYGLKTVVFIVAESVLGSVHAMGLGIGGLAEAATKALRGDFTGAKDALLQGWTEAKDRLGQIGDNIVEQARRNAAAMRQAWGSDSLFANNDPNARPKAGRSFTSPPKDGMDNEAIAEIIAEAKEAEKREQEIRDIRHKVQTENDNRELGQIQKLNDEKLAAQELATRQSLEMEEAANDERDRVTRESILGRLQFEKQMYRDRIDGALSFTNNLASLMNTESKRAFQLGKVAAIANAVIKGWEAAVSSYAAGAKIGGPWVGAAFAAASIAATANLINNIRNQQFGSGGGAPTPVGQGASGVAGGGLGTEGPVQQVQSQQQGSGIVVNLTVNGHILDTQQFADTILIPTLRDAIDNRDVTIIGTNSRQAAELAGA